jgi:ABC-type multidrug transport system ATPase subunit
VNTNTGVVNDAVSPAQQGFEVARLRRRGCDLSEAAGLPASATTLGADATCGQSLVVDPAVIAHPTGRQGRHRAFDLICSGAVTLGRMPGRRSVSDTVSGGGPTTPTGQQLDCLHVHRLGFTVRSHRLLSDVSFSASHGSLTAIIGPSGAGKSTLANLIAGSDQPSSGDVTFGGHNLHDHYAALRQRIGLVPQDNILHQQLTVEEALGYAAEIRLPRAKHDEHRRAVDNVLDELELTHRRQTRVDKLSGGERKRASVAMELLTGPSLLILDEPTSGLDPALDRQVMTMLRRLADAGRVVLVVTHCLTNLDVCDQVLFLTSRGKTAYFGPPNEIPLVMGTANWADIFSRVGADPDEVNREFLARRRASGLNDRQRSPLSESPERPARCQSLQQVSALIRRQLRLLVADRGYFAFLVLLPFVLGTLTLLVPGNVGLGTANPRGPVPDEPAQIVMLLNVSAVFMGTALTIRDLVGERAIFRREQSVGLSASSYLLAKISVYSAAATLQAAILTAIAVIGKGAPTHGAVVFGNPILELYITLALTAAISAINGMVLSSAAKSQDQILPMLVISVMLSIVLAGGLIPVTGRVVLNQLSWALPARWGYAASASTVDLRNIAALVPGNEKLWSHDPKWWLLDMVMLFVLGIAMTAIVRWRIRLSRRAPNPRVGAHRLRAPTREGRFAPGTQIKTKYPAAL